MNYKILFTFIICLGLTAFPGPLVHSQAETKTNTHQPFHITIDKKTIDKGYTVTAFDDTIKLSLVPGILASATPVEVLRLDEPMEYPWMLDRASDVYQFEFKNKSAYDNHKPYYIQMSYDESDDRLKKVFFFDKSYHTWRPLPTVDFPAEKFVRSLIHLPFARIAVFSYPDTLTFGNASWYAHKGGLFAASPDFPRGSRIRVHNPANGKFVDVTINDYGPDRSVFPKRPIDLDKLAFAKIADLRDGVVNVRLEPLNIVKDQDGLELGIPELGASSMPSTSARAAIVVDESNNQVLFAKNSTSSLPLASLTKIVAVSTFLSVNNDLDRVVAYSSNDAELNYEYCEPWESAKLSVPDGEKMTVRDLIYTSLAGSANNTVETLARVSGLSRPAFIEKMNTMSRDWGASSTKFIEPSGLSPDNSTTASDYAIIASKALENEIIRDASTIKEYKFTTLSTGINKRIVNTNQIIKTNKYNITGSKTGYLHESLYCLMTQVDIGFGKKIMVITFGLDKRDQSFRETEKLINYGIRKALKQI